MRNVLFIQGGGPGVHAGWDVYLVESLRRELGAGYSVRYPCMPEEGDPQVSAWRPAIERELAAVEPGAVVVGHSVGGTILLHVLTEAASIPTLSAIVLLAAPYVGPGGWSSDEITSPPDLAERLPPDTPILLYCGDADDVVPIAHLDLYAAALPSAQVRRLAGRDHQFNNDLSDVAADIRAATGTK